MSCTLVSPEASTTETAFAAILSEAMTLYRLRFGLYEPTGPTFPKINRVFKNRELPNSDVLDDHSDRCSPFAAVGATQAISLPPRITSTLPGAAGGVRVVATLQRTLPEQSFKTKSAHQELQRRHVDLISLPQYNMTVHVCHHCH